MRGPLASTSIGKSGPKSSLKASSIIAWIIPLYCAASALGESRMSSSWTVATIRTSLGSIAAVLTIASFKTSAAGRGGFGNDLHSGDCQRFMSVIRAKSSFLNACVT